MASLDSLPADQKAVLSLVLRRGQSFDKIAALLVIDRAAVRQRALQGFDALGPPTSVEPLKRGLITDYLLGQLPAAVAVSIRDSLASRPPERAWAQAIVAEIAPLAIDPLPEIPAAADVISGVAPAAAPAGAAFGAPPATTSTDAFGTRLTAAPPTPAASVEEPAAPPPSADVSLPSSRRTRAILVGLVALVVIVVVVVLVVTGGSSKHKTAARPGASSSTASKESTASAASSAQTLHQINLVSPTATKGREGAADVIRADGKLGIVLVAEGLVATPANAKHAYGVWLYDSKSGAGRFLGFYNRQVPTTGSTKDELEVETTLPANATKYNELLLTLETTDSPATPGTIILQGSFAE